MIMSLFILVILSITLTVCIAFLCDKEIYKLFVSNIETKNRVNHLEHMNKEKEIKNLTKKEIDIINTLVVTTSKTLKESSLKDYNESYLLDILFRSIRKELEDNK